MSRYSPTSSVSSKLISKYTHNTNTVIQPISLDQTTGIYTTATPHGLSVGDSLCINFNSWTDSTLPIQKIPFELYSTSYLATGGTGVIYSVPTSTTFTIKNNSSGTALLYNGNGTVNSSVDVNAFHFEKLTNFTINNIGKQNILLRFKALSVQDYGSIYWNGIEGRVNLNANNAASFYMVYGEVRAGIMFNNTIQGYISYAGTAIRNNGTTGNYTSNIGVNSGTAGPLHVINGTFGSTSRISSATIDTIGSGVRSSWLNGSIFEVYEMGD